MREGRRQRGGDNVRGELPHDAIVLQSTVLVQEVDDGVEQDRGINRSLGDEFSSLAYLVWFSITMNI